MKVLSIDGLFFKLPDDFHGGLGDALRALADYHDAPKTREGQKREAAIDSSKTWREMRTELWERFVEAVSDDAKVCGSVGLSEVQGTETTPLDTNTGVPRL